MQLRKQLTAIKPSHFCTAQVNLLGYEHNPDIMLLAARALTFLADVYPHACGAIIRHGAVPAFCARLLTIEFIDLAEQSLQVGGGVMSCHGLLEVAVVCLCGAAHDRIHQLGGAAAAGGRWGAKGAVP